MLIGAYKNSLTGNLKVQLIGLLCGWVYIRGGGRAYTQNNIFASRYMGLYPRAYKGGAGGIYTFCEHFEST